jgi:hypothetical protein
LIFVRKKSVRLDGGERDCLGIRANRAYLSRGSSRFNFATGYHVVQRVLPAVAELDQPVQPLGPRPGKCAYLQVALGFEREIRPTAPKREKISVTVDAGAVFTTFDRSAMGTDERQMIFERLVDGLLG